MILLLHFFPLMSKKATQSHEKNIQDRMLAPVVYR